MASDANARAQARRLAAQFTAVSRTARPDQLRGYADGLDRLAAQECDLEITFLAHAVGGLVGVSLQRPEAFGRLEAAVSAMRTGTLGPDPALMLLALQCLNWLIRPEEVRGLASDILNRDDLTDVDRAQLMWIVGLADAWAGDLVRGYLGLQEAHELAVRVGRPDLQAEVACLLAKVEAFRGDLEAARAHLAEGRRLGAETGSVWIANGQLECAAAIHLADGDEESRLAVLELLVHERQGVVSGLVEEYRLELATAHAMAGRPELAATIIAATTSGPRPWPGDGALQPWRAWILSPSDEGAMRSLAQAAARLNAPTEQMLAARLCWLLGAHQAGLGHRPEAISLLESARRTYAATGAPGMMRRVEATLSHLGEHVVPTVAVTPADGLLSPAELRVATAVRSGMSNREIAEALFLSVKTVEFHLGNIFRKLGVHNRTQLATHP